MPKTLRFGTPFLAERPLYDHLLAHLLAEAKIRLLSRPFRWSYGDRIFGS